MTLGSSTCRCVSNEYCEESFFVTITVLMPTIWVPRRLKEHIVPNVSVSLARTEVTFPPSAFVTSEEVIRVQSSSADSLSSDESDGSVAALLLDVVSLALSAVGDDDAELHAVSMTKLPNIRTNV